VTETRVGEVIEATTADLTAQCYQLYGLPPLGSLVRVGNNSDCLYAVVCEAATAGIDPGRRPIARGRDAASEDEIYRDSPQLSQLLRSDFKALVTGHRQDASIHHYLPPQPAKVHSFVYLCDPDEIRMFSQSFGFLNILVNARTNVPVEELVAACLRQLSQAHDDRRAFLVAAGKELAADLSGRYDQLKMILDKIKNE
jgi:hypothetical protein